MERERLLARLRLALTPGIGPRTLKALSDHFGGVEPILSATRQELLAIDGVGPKLADALFDCRQRDEAAEELALCESRQIELLSADSDRFPHMLREIFDPPSILFMRGQFESPDHMAVAIVGSRHATQYGKKLAQQLASSLSRAGLTIVSGLARGIDAAAHRGALEAGGRTLAVLGSGVLNIYPPEHAELAEQVVQHGAVVSESPCRSAPQSGNFPQRNRIISGLSLGVIVVEASQRSGALITAKHAMEQGREVFAVPGRVDSRMSRGCHALIRDGARLVESADDVLEELGPLAQPAKQPDGTLVHHPAELQLNDLEREVLQAVTSEPISIDVVCHQTGLPIQRVLSTISVLEIRHLVHRVSGNYVSRR